MDKLSQLRQMREQRQRWHTKAIAERVEARSSRVEPTAHNGRVDSSSLSGPTNSSPHEASSEPDTKRVAKAEKRKRSTAVRLVETQQPNEGKPAMTEAAPQVWSKGLYQNLYMKRQRAKTPDERAAAETALRTAFPKTRPRKVKAALPKIVVPKKKKPVRKKVKAKPVKAKTKPAARKKAKKKKKGKK